MEFIESIKNTAKADATTTFKQIKKGETFDLEQAKYLFAKPVVLLNVAFFPSRYFSGFEKTDRLLDNCTDAAKLHIITRMRTLECDSYQLSSKL